MSAVKRTLPPPSIAEDAAENEETCMLQFAERWARSADAALRPLDIDAGAARLLRTLELVGSMWPAGKKPDSRERTNRQFAKAHALGKQRRPAGRVQ